MIETDAENETFFHIISGSIGFQKIRFFQRMLHHPLHLGKGNAQCFAFGDKDEISVLFHTGKHAGKARL